MVNQLKINPQLIIDPDPFDFFLTKPFDPKTAVEEITKKIEAKIV